RSRVQPARLVQRRAAQLDLDTPIAPHPIDQLAHEARLPDARFTPQPNHLPVTKLRAPPRGDERVDLGPAADQRCQTPGRYGDVETRACARVGHRLIKLDRPLDTLEHVWTEWRELEVSLTRQLHGLSQCYLSGRRDRLYSRCNVRALAHDVDLVS